jgi:hypothetical protein
LRHRTTPSETLIKILTSCEISHAEGYQANALFHDGFSVEDEPNRNHILARRSSSNNYCDDFELLELPAFDLPEPESLDDEVEELLLEEDDDESDVDAAGLLPPESDLPSEAAAEMSVLPSDLLAESDDVAGLLPDLA